MRSFDKTLRPWLLAATVVTVLSAGIARAAGPMIDWDPAYAYAPGSTVSNLAIGTELKLVGTISHFDNPLGDLNANDPTREYTFYAHGLISQGTVPSGPPSLTLYETHFTGGSIEIYEDLSPDASFAPNPPNGTVPSKFQDGTLILAGTFNGAVLQANNFTPLNTGNFEGNIVWTGGTLLSRTFGALGAPCGGLFTGGATWYPSTLISGYLFRHAGKIDLQCAVPTRTSTWGRIKTLYR